VRHVDGFQQRFDLFAGELAYMVRSFLCGWAGPRWPAASLSVFVGRLPSKARIQLVDVGRWLPQVLVLAEGGHDQGGDDVGAGVLRRRVSTACG